MKTKAPLTRLCVRISPSDRAYLLGQTSPEVSVSDVVRDLLAEARKRDEAAAKRAAKKGGAQ